MGAVAERVLVAEMVRVEADVDVLLEDVGLGRRTFASPLGGHAAAAVEFEVMSLLFCSMR